MKILHITTFMQGGAGLIIQNLALEQKQMGHDVTILTSETSEPGYCNYDEYIKNLQCYDINVIKLDSTFKRDIYLNLNVTAKVSEIIDSTGIDIIHAHAAIPALVGLIARSGKDKYIPVIQTMHGWGTNKTTEHEKMDITIMNGVDTVVAVSNSDSNFLEAKGIDRRKIKHIYNGIKNCNSIIPLEDKISQELRAFKKKGTKIIGCVGTLCDRKNQLLLLDAFNRLQKSSDLVCIFIGEGDMVFKIENIAKKYKIYDKVRLYGYRTDASKYLKYFDYMVLPSKSEGFSIAVLESFQNKTVTIVSDIDTFQEIVEDGKTGYIFKSNNVDSLTDTLQRVLNESGNKLNYIVENAHDKYINHFTLELMTKEYNDLYTKLIDFSNKKSE